MSKDKTRSSNWKEQRRFHALELKRRGWKQADIAVALKVSKGAVSQWVTLAEMQGEKVCLLARTWEDRPSSRKKRSECFPTFIGMTQKPMDFVER